MIKNGKVLSFGIIQKTTSLSMSVLPSPSEKAIIVQKMFDRIAPGYDRLNRIITLGLDQLWRKKLLKELNIQENQRVLDLACGTGDFAKTAALYGAKVIALDFSPNMLHYAQKRQILNATLIQGDALSLPLHESSFDIAVSGFALRNFSTIQPVFNELHRILVKGGQLGLLEIDKPKNRILKKSHAIYFTKIVPLIGGILSDRAAYQYLPASEAYLPKELELFNMLEQSGFTKIKKRSLLGGAAQMITALKN